MNWEQYFVLLAAATLLIPLAGCCFLIVANISQWLHNSQATKPYNRRPLSKEVDPYDAVRPIESVVDIREDYARVSGLRTHVYLAPSEELVRKETAQIEKSFSLLGLSPNASDARVRFAYRKLFKHYHPRTAEPGEASLEMLRRIEFAYEEVQNYRRKKQFEKQNRKGSPR